MTVDCSRTIHLNEPKDLILGLVSGAGIGGFVGSTNLKKLSRFKVKNTTKRIKESNK